ncbi:hypothetical protein T12_7742 [Trichinella patagoniensis]|uniref:Uncharacterized protein n=1 Tax=Trichinella patagoniensis TaxID=990121 RepID=A0A0V1A125_9BILA|nr:hypothetical protein T12_7742 [Trichinella patagoniensis]
MDGWMDAYIHGTLMASPTSGTDGSQRRKRKLLLLLKMNYQLNAHHFFNHLLIIVLCLQMPYSEETVETNITTTNDMLTTPNNETETTTIEADRTITTVELETDNVEMKKSNDRHTPTVKVPISFMLKPVDHKIMCIQLTPESNYVDIEITTDKQKVVFLVTAEKNLVHWTVWETEGSKFQGYFETHCNVNQTETYPQIEITIMTSQNALIRLTGNRESYYDRHLNNESATGVVIRNAHNRTAMSCEKLFLINKMKLMKTKLKRKLII